MSGLPLYEKAEPPTDRPAIDAHRGLWYERFFDGYPTDWRPNRNEKSRKDWAEAKRAWIDRAAKSEAGTKNASVSAAARLSRLCTALGGKTLGCRVTWHFATGLGIPHPVENGFLWHPTLGVPYIPGAAVKGLVRAWIEAWMYDDESRSKERLDILYRWFGSEDKGFKERKKARKEGFKPPSQGRDVDTEAGAFIFFDALPTGPVKLKTDVTTPHMGKWYEKGGEIESLDQQSDYVPADWHDPVPVYFLVADRPEFQFAVAPRTDAARAELPDVLEALGSALEWLGAGAKTAVGYGTMKRNPDAEAVIRAESEKQEQRLRDAAESARLEEKFQAALARMDPFEREIAEFVALRADKSQTETAAVIAAVKQSKWQGEQKRRVALWLEQKMKAAKGQWKPESRAKRPEKDRAHQRTLLVMSWLERMA